MLEDKEKFIKKIKNVIESPLEVPRTLSNSYSAYDYGLRNRDDVGTLEDFIRTTIQSDFAFEDGITRKLTLENSHDLAVHAMEPTSVKMYSAVDLLTNEEVEYQELEEVEMDIRNDINYKDFNLFFQQLLAAGMAVMSCGLRDNFHCFDTRDCDVDYRNGRYIIANREIEGEILNDVIANWENEFDEYEEMPDMLVDDLENYTIKHGQYKIKSDLFVEFVLYQNILYFKFHKKPCIISQIYMTEIRYQESIGIWGACAGEEIEYVKCQNAISDRMSKMINASLLIPENTLESEDLGDLFSGKKITFNPDKMSGGSENPGSGSPFIFPPARTNEIKDLIQNMDRLMYEARKKTGLFEKPVNVPVQGQVTATQATIAYHNANDTKRQIIHKFTNNFGNMLYHVAMRDYSIEAEIEVVSNPIDQEKRITFIKEYLPIIIKSMQDDPTGATLGGLFNERTVAEMIKELLEDSKIHTRILATPTETALSSEENMKKAQEKKEEAADVIANAEVLKAKAEMLTAESSMVRSQNEIVKAKIQKEKNEGELLLELLRLKREGTAQDQKLAADFLMEIHKEKQEAKKESKKEVKNA